MAKMKKETLLSEEAKGGRSKREWHKQLLQDQNSMCKKDVDSNAPSLPCKLYICFCLMLCLKVYFHFQIQCTTTEGIRHVSSLNAGASVLCMMQVDARGSEPLSVWADIATDMWTTTLMQTLEEKDFCGMI